MRNIVDRIDHYFTRREPERRSSLPRPGPRRRTYDTHRRSPTPHPRHHNGRPCSRSRSPRCRYPTNNFVEQHLEDEMYRIPRSEGKAHFLSDLYVKELIPKPYMYVERLGQTLKKKLEKRDTVTALEYINAFIALLRGRRVERSRDHDYMFEHLHDVTKDATRRPWADVGQWSQRVFDAIEKGTLFWDDRQGILNERFAMALPGIQTNDSSNGGGLVQEVICADFNSDKGCSAVVTGVKEKAHHMEGNIKCAHICMYCMAAATQRQPHAVSVCYRKDRHRTATSGHGANHYQAPHPPRPTNPHQYGPFQRSDRQFSSQLSKNGQ